MKYVVIIPDGAADRPIDALEGKTPFEAARTPNLDRLARAGRVGTVATTPPKFGASSDVCSMSLLGYDPAQHHTGRAPIEAASMGLPTEPGDWIFRLNLVTVGDAGPAGEPQRAGRAHAEPGGLMLDHSGGSLSDDEARELIDGLRRHWAEHDPELAAGFDLVHGKSYRSILIDRTGSAPSQGGAEGGAGVGGGRRYDQVKLAEPHGIPGRVWEDHLPEPLTREGEIAAEALTRLTELSAGYLADAPVNRARIAKGLAPANLAWIWGQGTPVTLPSFTERFGVSGAMISSVDLLTGLGRAMGLDIIEVDGLTSYHDTDYVAQGRATADAIARYDLVVSHIEAPDELSHKGDWATKVASLEAIDLAIIGPVADALAAYGNAETDPDAEGWRILVMPDHYTLCATRQHDATPVPFMMAGGWVRSVVERTLTERDADASDLHIDPGHELMEYFLRGGLARVRGTAGR